MDPSHVRAVGHMFDRTTCTVGTANTDEGSGSVSNSKGQKRNMNLHTP